MDIYDAYFEIIVKDNEGTFLKLFPRKDNGSDIDINKVFKTLESKGLTEYNADIIKESVKNLEDEKEIKISTSIIGNVNESFEINISKDRLEAFIRFFPPIGNGEKITRDFLISELDKKNIIFGIDIELINQIIKNKEYYKDYIIAKGKKVIDGIQPEINYFFSLNLDGKPMVNEDGSVDFHSLNIINNIKKDDLLAQLIPGQEGETGTDVLGNEIKPKKIKPMVLKYGKNVRISDDKLNLYAEKDGFVIVEDDKIVVYDCYEVAADVDSSTGNIVFDGTVIIKGNVRTGFTIKAKGDIEVYGVVEGATLISENQVILRRGMQGMGKGIIQAKGNLISKFIENSTVKVGGYIHSDAILHSNVTAKGEIIVEGKKGMVTGGEVRSGVEIRTKILGSHMGTITNVAVGIDPSVVDEYNQINKELIEIKEEMNKMDQIINLLKTRQIKNGTLEPDKIQMLQNATRNKIFLEGKLKTSNRRFEELSEELENKNAGRIKVMNIIYPGVRVTIGNVKYFIREEQKYCSLYKDGADIKIASYV
ncbi:hypothetical protein EDC18_104224 [Natranaerovirga pectinivora]|uniref:Flagellar Assembly Protein A N-terminal region domain-containing protein n=2 Tax=Natranaerovirga pectinivora TaxID=682400 RepID=A0A4R3MLV0_9FIRM|nr:hypothetical protein EDC18_104224 [Natranaerovirga pectinivora]